MEQKKSRGFGFRGWMLIVYQFIAYITYQSFTQYPLNILAPFYGGAQKVSSIYSICAVIGILVQVLLAGVISRMKKIKLFGSILGAVTLVLAILVMTLPAGTVWNIAYALINIVAVLYATFALGILIGQWFPTRKGVVMGIATLAFPIANGLLGPFASAVFGKTIPAMAGSIGAALSTGDGALAGVLGPIMGMLESGDSNGMISALVNTDFYATSEGLRTVVSSTISSAFLPFFIVSVIGWLIGIIFIRDYPEECGAFRDNDRSMTPEVAKAIMEQEIKNKKTSVWTYLHTLSCKEFWFGTICVALLLSCSIGLMSQSNAIITHYTNELSFLGNDPYTTVMIIIMIFGCVGSYVLGVLDQKLGTRKAMIISTVLMIIGGVLGLFNNAIALLLAMVFVAMFMGASSNFGVSAAAQYWRREDFSRIFTLSSPIGSAIASASPVVIAALLFITNADGSQSYKGHAGAFAFVAVCGVIALVVMLLYSPKHIKAMDDKFRAAAGKPLDDELLGRK